MYKLITAAALAIAAAFPAAAQVTITVNGETQQIPAGVMRTITTLPNGRQKIVDSPWTGGATPGMAAITTTETTDEDDRGRVLSRRTVTRIEPQQVAYSQPVVTVVQQQPMPMPYPQQQGYQGYQPYPQQGMAPGRAAPRDYAETSIEDAPPSTPHVIRVHRDSWGGHFVAPVTINGRTIRAIIDTGAAYTILSANDARTVGADQDVIRTEAAVGIGGMTQVGVARLRSIEIAGQQLGRITARIGQPGIPYTLLGETEINKLGSISIQGGVMTITPRGMEQPQQIASR